MNWTQVVETIPAVTTIRMTTIPTINTPIAKLDIPMNVVGKPEQRLHQRAGADHLRNQVENADDERADGGGQLDAAAVELGVEGVGEGEFAQALERLGDDKQRDHPSAKKSDGIKKSVVPVKRDHPANAEKRRGRQDSRRRKRRH